MVALSHNNRLLSEVVKGNCNNPAAPCWIPNDDRASSELQVKEISDFVKRYPAWMEVALTAADLHRIVRANKMAVVLGIEIDNIGDFCPEPPPPQLKSDPNFCRRATPQAVTAELQQLYGAGVRYIFPVHVTDNLFGGTAPYNALFSVANLYETGHFWNVECAGTQPFPDDEIGFDAPDLMKEIPDPFKGMIPKGLPIPSAPQGCAFGGHRNTQGLTVQGQHAVKEMMRLGFIIDIDHTSHRTTDAIMSIAESIPAGGYPLMSGHSSIRTRGTRFE